MTEKAYLDPSLTLRSARWDDLVAIAEFTQQVGEFEGDALFVLTAEELANEWQSAGFNVARDVLVVEADDGRIVASAEFFQEGEHSHLFIDGRVHPDFKGRGIGSALLQRIDERARAEMALAAPHARVFIQCTINNRNAAGHALLRGQGYVPVRYQWHMEITLQEAPPPATFPAHIELRPFVPEEHATAVWEAENEAFRDHWGSHEQGYEEWSLRKLKNPDFDPTLWMVAWDGEAVAGFAQTRYRKGSGWIWSLGVRQAWRKQGLGLALLRHSFGEFYRRGTTTIGLGVDSSSLTGATRLYERAGMRVAAEFATYEKQLRAARR